MTGIAQRTPSVETGMSVLEYRRLLADQRFERNVHRAALAEIELLERQRLELMAKSDALAVQANRLRVWLAGRNVNLLRKSA